MAKKIGLIGVHASKKVMIMTFKGKPYNLTGEDLKVKVPETDNNPAGERIIPGAPQEVLRELHEKDEHGDWSRILGEVEETAKPAKAKP